MSNGQWPFHLKVNGTVLKNAMVSGLVINQQLGEHSWVDIRFRLLDEQRPPVEDYLGKSLDFFTLDDQGAELPLFEGIACEVELEYGLHGDYGARVRGVTAPTTWTSPLTKNTSSRALCRRLPLKSSKRTGWSLPLTSTATSRL